MYKFAANLNFLFTELPFMARFAAARAAGFEGVEVLFPYDHPPQEIRGELTRNGLVLALMNVPPPNWAGGERGFAAVPGGEDRFQEGFERAMHVADVLKPQRLHVMAGRASGPLARRALVDNLKWACRHGSRHQFTLEPVNPRDMPGFFLSDFALAVEILDEVKAPNLSLQFDYYHAQMLAGDPMSLWERYKSRVGHVQIASAPDRREPRGMTVEHSGFFARLSRDGYRGWVGAEYTPGGVTADSLSWMSRPPASPMAGAPSGPRP
jgi:2-dehydrotetronate isomerase